MNPEAEFWEGVSAALAIDFSLSLMDDELAEMICHVLIPPGVHQVRSVPTPKLHGSLGWESVPKAKQSFKGTIQTVEVLCERTIKVVCRLIQHLLRVRMGFLKFRLQTEIGRKKAPSKRSRYGSVEHDAKLYMTLISYLFIFHVALVVPSKQEG